MVIGIIIAILLLLLVIGAFGAFKQTKQENEVAAAVNENSAKLDNFGATKIITGPLGLYKVKIDENSEKVAYISKNGSRVFSYDDIISVELQESGNTVSQKSTTRTIGGAVLGGVLAGGAGAIVGGLSGSSTQRRKISSIIVKVTLRDVTDPTVNIVCFENYKLPPYSDDEGLQLFYAPALEIVDTLNVIIDLVDKRSNPQPNPVISSESSNLADEISKLHGMLKEGIITEDEFSKMKERLINR